MLAYDKWTRSKTALLIVFTFLIITVWLIISHLDTWFVADHRGPPRPATINNVVSAIESNVMRIQTILENLVFSEYPSEIADDIDSINQLELAIYRDLKEMGSHFRGDNTHYQKALTLFREWKSIRDEVIILITAGPSPQARIIALGKCLAHAREIRDALTALNRFSEKRANDFDSSAYPGAREKHVVK